MKKFISLLIILGVIFTSNSSFSQESDVNKPISVMEMPIPTYCMDRVSYNNFLEKYDVKSDIQPILGGDTGRNNIIKVLILSSTGTNKTLIVSRYPESVTGELTYCVVLMLENVSINKE